MKNTITIPLAFFIFISHPVFADELYPLEVGRYWRYVVEGDGPKSMTNSITRSKTVRGTTWYLLNEWGENFWVRNAPAGQIEAVNLSLDDPPTRKVDELLIYKYPYTVAEPYSLHDDQVVVEEEREVTVPAFPVFPGLAHLLSLAIVSLYVWGSRRRLGAAAEKGSPGALAMWVRLTGADNAQGYLLHSVCRRVSIDRCGSAGLSRPVERQPVPRRIHG
jgi:hypothetical protein